MIHVIGGPSFTEEIVAAIEVIYNWGATVTCSYGKYSYTAEVPMNESSKSSDDTARYVFFLPVGGTISSPVDWKLVASNGVKSMELTVSVVTETIYQREMVFEKNLCEAYSWTTDFDPGTFGDNPLSFGSRNGGEGHSAHLDKNTMVIYANFEDNDLYSGGLITSQKISLDGMNSLYWNARIRYPSDSHFKCYVELRTGLNTKSIVGSQRIKNSGSYIDESGDFKKFDVSQYTEPLYIDFVIKTSVTPDEYTNKANNQMWIDSVYLEV